MQTSKYLFAVGAFAAVILPLQVQGGPDSDDQLKMRAALRRALEQPNAPQQSQPVATQPAAAEPAKPAPTPPPPEPQPAPVTPVAPPPVTPTVVVETPQTFEPVPAADDPASVARAREAMRQKLQELQSTPTPTPAPVSAPVAAPSASVAAVTPAPAPKPAPTPVAAPASYYTAIDAPASPFSAAKQAKLADLLTRYRADSITSQEYHTQRAAIIAEP